MNLSISEFFISIAIISSALAGYSLKRIDLLGAISGIVLAFFIWYGGGEECLLVLFLFFILGTFASSWKKKAKQALGLAQENDGKRGISNVLGNGGTAALLGIISIISGETQIPFNLMITASFAAACSDTFSSEFGNIYGRKYYYITTLKTAPRGVDGVISLQGLVFGLVGSTSIAASSMIFHHRYELILLLIFCGFSGNLFDSLLGATLQRKKYLNNHHVNFGATLFGSMMYLAFSRWLFS